MNLPRMPSVADPESGRFYRLQNTGVNKKTGKFKMFCGITA